MEGSSLESKDLRGCFVVCPGAETNSKRFAQGAMVRAPSKSEREAARNVLRRSLRVKRGENVLIEVWEHNLPFASAFVDESCRIGAIPYVQYQDHYTFWSEFKRGNPDYFGKSGAIERAALERADAYVYFIGPEDLDRALARAPSSPKFWKRFLAYQTPFYRIARRTGLRGSRMSIAYATAPDARKYHVNLSRWHRELIDACRIDPSTMKRAGARLAAALSRASRITIRHPNGTGLEVRAKGTPPRVFTGMHSAEDMAEPTGMLNDLPWGALSVELDSRSGEGLFVSNRPSYYSSGMTSGARWRFADGRLLTAAFTSGRRTFSRVVRQSGPEADRLGSLLIGLNPAIHRAPNVQFAERAAVSIQLGQRPLSGGYPSSSHPKATLAGGEVLVNGRRIVHSGRIA